ncbi:cupin domain-containing protein [Mycobacterium sp. SMC-4]|uniref:cupin domain-containing protein n=1 Tax=Mycobacterium sp. SMC-4 TaxID=2857059 RepID=UPI003CFC71E0
MTQILGNVSTVELSYSESAADGHPAIKTGVHALDEVAGGSMGLWEAKAGVFVGAPHADEVFVVLSGSVTLATTDQGTPVSATQGDIVRLAKGVEVRWDIADTLRIFYVFP